MTGPLFAQQVVETLGGGGNPDTLLARQMQALSLAVHIPIVCFGIAFPAMFLFVGYIASTRHFRREMDVSTFMATPSSRGSGAPLTRLPAAAPASATPGRRGARPGWR